MTNSTTDPVTTNVMNETCCIVLYCDRSLSTCTINRHAAAVFGLQPYVIVFLWYSLEGLLPKAANLEHLL